MQICITNATGIAAYNLAFRIADSKIFDHPVELVLYEHPNVSSIAIVTLYSL